MKPKRKPVVEMGWACFYGEEIARSITLGFCDIPELCQFKIYQTRKQAAHASRGMYGTNIRRVRIVEVVRRRRR